MTSPGEGTYTLQYAQRKARYGHRDWLFWTDRSGSSQCAPKSKESIKKAMLASGTQGRWFVVSASTAVLQKGFWAMGVIMLRNAEHGI
ncbi:hypothetical protein [Microvirga sp. VF16]|uniref:hypothetical protein n=1 Tax=Microvirga sp. VF16 TaxID=2807101 RepID=UPI00193E1CF8|nr:hypothetical protein [Microvirga sp. VF16]QRM34891.1 hypothetical protein JO965_42285 [Microvirga sp. VF16]